MIVILYLNIIIVKFLLQIIFYKRFKEENIKIVNKYIFYFFLNNVFFLFYFPLLNNYIKILKIQISENYLYIKKSNVGLLRVLSIWKFNV